MSYGSHYLIPGWGSAQPTKIVSAGDGPTTLVNNDNTNTVYFDNDIGVNPTRTTTVFLPPQASTSVDGKSDIYAICAIGLTADFITFPGIVPWNNPVGVQISLNDLGLMKDSTGQTINTNVQGTTGAVNNPAYGPPTHTDVATTLTGAVNNPAFGPAKHTDIVALTAPSLTIAEDVAANGTFALSGSSNLLNIGNTNIPAGGSQVEGPFNVPTTGYVFFVSVEGNSVSSDPFLSVQFAFTDATSGRQTDFVQWDVAVGSGTFQQYKGYGPANGDKVTITYVNNDSANQMTIVSSFTANSKVYAKHDLTPINFQTTPGFSKPNSEPGSNNLFSVNASVAASGDIQRLIPLYSGLIEISITNPGAASISVVVNPVGSPVSGIGGATGAPIWSQTVAANSTLNAQFPLTRSSAVVTIFNNSASAAVTPSVAGSVVESPT